MGAGFSDLAYCYEKDLKVIPSFAIERSQEILYHLNELLIADRIPHILVFVDSPMAVRTSDGLSPAS